MRNVFQIVLGPGFCCTLPRQSRAQAWRISHSMGEGRGIWPERTEEEEAGLYRTEAGQAQRNSSWRLLPLVRDERVMPNAPSPTPTWGHLLVAVGLVKVWCRSCTCWFLNNWPGFPLLQMDWLLLSTLHPGNWAQWWNGAQLPGGCTY